MYVIINNQKYSTKSFVHDPTSLSKLLVHNITAYYRYSHFLFISAFYRLHS